MSLLLSLLYIGLGFFILIVGGEALVRGSISLAVRFKVKPALIGLTIVAFGTSAPELVTSLAASFKGSSDIAIGNVIGSNIFNTFAILGVTSILTVNLVEKSIFKFELPVMIFTSVLLALFVQNLVITRIEGILLIVVFVGFLIWSFIQSKAPSVDTDDMKPLKYPIFDLFFLMVGIGGLIGGAELALTGAIEVGKAFGLSDRVIGITIVSAGTSLPELVTSAVAAFRGRSDIAVNNVIGSNIFNILLVAGGTATITSIPVSPTIVSSHIYWLLLSAILLPKEFWAGKLRISKFSGFGFLILFFSYMGLLLLR